MHSKNLWRLLEEFYKSESWNENEVAEFTQWHVSYERPSDSKWSAHCWFCSKCAKDYVGPQIWGSLEMLTSSPGPVHDFEEFLQNSLCSWQKNHCCFGSDRKCECTPESGESVPCESGQDRVWWSMRMRKMRILTEKESYRGKRGPQKPHPKQFAWTL